MSLQPFHTVHLSLPAIPGGSPALDPSGKPIPVVSIDGRPVDNVRRIEVVGGAHEATVVRLEFLADVEGDVAGIIGAPPHRPDRPHSMKEAQILADREKPENQTAPEPLSMTNLLRRFDGKVQT